MSRFKRAFDVAGACAGVLVFAPVPSVGDGGPTICASPVSPGFVLQRKSNAGLVGKTRVQRMLRRAA